MSKHLTLLSRIVLIGGLLLVVYLGIAYSSHQLRESSLKGCQRRNAAQLSALRSSTALKATAEREVTLFEAEHDLAALHIAENELDQQKMISSELKENAEKTGYATVPGYSVTIECGAAYPEALPWPGD